MSDHLDLKKTYCTILEAACDKRILSNGDLAKTIDRQLTESLPEDALGSQLSRLHRAILICRSVNPDEVQLQEII